MTELRDRYAVVTGDGADREVGAIRMTDDEWDAGVTRMRQDAPTTVVVMMLPNRSRPGGNPFVGLLVDSLDADISTVAFSWRRALTGRFDVFHAHWPEYLLEGRTPVQRAIRGILLVLVVGRARILKRSIAVTAHNRRAHDGLGGLSDRVYGWFFRSADKRIFLNEFDRLDRRFQQGDVVIPHGDYASVVAQLDDLQDIDPEPLRVIVFGSLRPYKGIEALIEAVAAVPDVRLDVTGRPADERYAAQLDRLSKSAANVEINVGEVDDSTLAARVRRASLVALPYPDLYNSGAALMALTLGRTVLLPESPTALELQDEFGQERVVVYSPPLTPATIESGARYATSQATSVGLLSKRREWSAIGPGYSEVFRRLKHVSKGRS